jgi:acyl-CoA synthetase (AMP-forming)/AMP-acid ligase II
VPVSVTYRELDVRVNEFAALLRDFCGLKSGDRGKGQTSRNSPGLLLSFHPPFLATAASN